MAAYDSDIEHVFNNWTCYQLMFTEMLSKNPYFITFLTSESKIHPK